MTNRRRVQFSEKPPSVLVFEDGCDLISREERKQLCWYNESELAECRLDARLAIKMLIQFKGNLPDGVNFRGVEKYGSIELQKFKKRRVVVHSVLLRQMEHRHRHQSQTDKAACCCPTKMALDLAALSRHLSKPSTLLAHFHAVKQFGAGEGAGGKCWKSYVQSVLKKIEDSPSHKRLIAVAGATATAGGRPNKKRCLTAAAS
jgi:hypothetical protein